ncbi:DEAD/DEAH box helicase [Arcanobacterium urinimassiliense]|uniref:DEAD/DEAH box helicase n=1 Tax=Arcanobacterium urinimassiliense TaxID=1871014 RepID=UPI00093A9A1F|nr:DEAD/DEAH box helicase [Arcanobacterium urinimassiliense]
MRYKPHAYQDYTTTFIEKHPQAAVFLEMGLGKTVATLTAIEHLLLDSFEVSKVLVIAPLRVARDTWPEEIAKWEHLRLLKTISLVGSKKLRLENLEKQAHVYLINRENVPWLVEVLGKSWPFDMVIIDELSSFKSNQSKRFKALRSVLPKIKRIVGLTGTPASNGLMDLWAPFRLIDGGARLGKYITHYREAYFVPDKRNQHMVFSWRLREGAEEEIYKKISDITVSMQTQDYLQLPKIIYTQQKIRLGIKEQKFYRKLKQELVADLDGGEVDAVNAAVLSNKLLQLASGAIYGENKSIIHVHDLKLDALEDVVEAANGQSLLVAYWFKHDLERIQERFPQARLLESSKDFQDWNQGKISLALIHPASAGHGLNLQAGGHLVCWFSLTWSLELYQQLNARLYRQGQTRPVTITHLIATGTIDERVVKALQNKNVTQAALIEAVKTEIKKGNQQ